LEKIFSEIRHLADTPKILLLENRKECFDLVLTVDLFGKIDFICKLAAK